MSRNSHRRRKAQVLLRIVDQFARILERRIATELSRLIQEAASRYPNPPSYRTHEKHLLQILRSVLLSAGQVAAERVREDIQKSAPWLTERKLDTEEELRRRIVTIAERQAANRVTGMTRTSRSRIQNAVARGLEREESPSQIAKRIREISEMSRSRARTIARTEAHQTVMSAQHTSMEETAEELGMKLMKVWVTTEDDRTRESHVEADGQKVAIEDSFQVGDATLLHPGDPSGPPEEVINCRCGLVWEPA